MTSFKGVEPRVAAEIAAASADLALVLDADGVVLDVAYSADGLDKDGVAGWVGRLWVETATVETRPKIEALIAAAWAGAAPRWRQVNHPTAFEQDLAVAYRTLELTQPEDRSRRLVAIGRDLRPSAALQRRLMDAQLAMERDYAKHRLLETRYRLLFQTSADPALILDLESAKVLEANPAALAILGRSGGQKLMGRRLSDGAGAEAAAALASVLAAAKHSGEAQSSLLSLPGADGPLALTASVFRQDGDAFALVRLRAGADTAVEPDDVSAASDVVRRRDAAWRFWEQSPDAAAATSADGRILQANDAFLDLGQLAAEEQVAGAPLSRHLGRLEVDTDALFSALRERRAVRNFRTVFRGRFDYFEEVEVSACALSGADPVAFVFVIRRVDTAAAEASADEGPRDLPRSVEQLTQLVGRVPLRDLVRETTDVIERLCIEAALQLTGDNRASAAEVLGLSRQSLYVKLRRYGLGDLDGEDAGPSTSAAVAKAPPAVAKAPPAMEEAPPAAEQASPADADPPALATGPSGSQGRAGKKPAGPAADEPPAKPAKKTRKKRR